MTAFEKSKFEYGGGYLSYEGQFVARFKYKPSNRAGFVSFLMKNFTVEEFFGRRADDKSPMSILQSKGYVSAHVKKWLIEAGLPPTLAGQEEFMRRQAAARERERVPISNNGS
jgi:hypothetical protein